MRKTWSRRSDEQFFWYYVCSANNIPMLRLRLRITPAGITTIDGSSEYAFGGVPDTSVVIALVKYEGNSVHQNFLYYDATANTFEHFEPHGGRSHGKRIAVDVIKEVKRDNKKRIREAIANRDELIGKAGYTKAVERVIQIKERATRSLASVKRYHANNPAQEYPMDSFIRQRVKALGARYVPVSETCPDVGLQQGNIYGSCLFWSLLVVEMRIMNPDASFMKLQTAFREFLETQRMTTNEYILEYNNYLNDLYDRVRAYASSVGVPFIFVTYNQALMRTLAQAIR